MNCKVFLGILVGIIGLSVGIGTVICFTPINEAHSIGIMLTLISVIVTLGVAYSFFSIYKAQTEVSDIRKEFNRLSKKFQIMSSNLKMETERLKSIYDFNNCSLEAEGKFRDRKFLIALKNGLAGTLFLLNHKKSFSDEEFESYIGNNRAKIAKYFLEFIETITAEKFAKIPKHEFTDSYNTIIRFAEDIRCSNNWKNINSHEQHRYTFLFDKLLNVLRELDKPEFLPPLNNDPESKAKISFYFRTYIISKNSDVDNQWEDYRNKYLNGNLNSASIYVP